MLIVPFDTETTGLGPGSRMVELAAIVYDPDANDGEGDIIDDFSTLVNPGMPIPSEATEIHGITDAMVQDSPTIIEALNEFEAWMPDLELRMVAHNAAFDCNIIRWCADFGDVFVDDYPVICTREISRQIGATKKHTLEALIEHYGIERRGEAHRAISDALACGDYYLKVRGQHTVDPESFLQAGTGHLYTSNFPELLHDLPELVSCAGRLTVDYQDAKGDVTKGRQITPYGWSELDGVFHFHGWCHLREGVRNFRGDRILDRS